MTSFIAPSTALDAAFDPDELAPLRNMLAEELAVQERQIREFAATIDELTGQQDSDSMLERELAEYAHRRALETITEIRQALQRMDAGMYGICERCQSRIALARLEVIPFTRHCVSCPPPTPPLIG